MSAKANPLQPAGTPREVVVPAPLSNLIITLLPLLNVTKSITPLLSKSPITELLKPVVVFTFFSVKRKGATADFVVNCCTPFEGAQPFVETLSVVFVTVTISPG